MQLGGSEGGVRWIHSDCHAFHSHMLLPIRLLLSLPGVLSAILRLVDLSAVFVVFVAFVVFVCITRYLSKRLLSGRSVSDEAEKNLIGKFKQECGYQVNGERRIERDKERGRQRGRERGGGGKRQRKTCNDLSCSLVMGTWCGAV